MFSDRDAINGERLARHLLKTCQREDVNSAFGRAHDVYRARGQGEGTLTDGNVTGATQSALTNLHLPTR